MRAVFADPKTRVVFKRIFGNEAHKDLLIALLNDLLGLQGQHRVVDLQYLTPEQAPPIDGLKVSIVDVKCTDASGIRYLVEMQVLNVEGFEKRIVYNLCKAYTAQLARGDDYPLLNDVVGVAICDFMLWPELAGPDRYEIDMLSRWRMVEEKTGARRLSQMRYAFLELPKYRGGDEPVSTVDRWAYFFREAQDLRTVPKALSEGPWARALDVARTSRFTEEEWEAYDRAKMAEQDSRGALSLARREGEARGRVDGLRETALDLLALFNIPVTDDRRARLQHLDERGLRDLIAELARDRRWD